MDKRVLKTKAAIRKAYFSMLIENEDKKITISDIARKADIDRKTFYLHYSHPEEIFKEYITETIEKFLSNLEKSSAEENGYSIALFFDVLTEMLLNNEETIALLTSLDSNSFFFDTLRTGLIKIVLDDYSQIFNFSERDIKIYSEFYISGIISAYRLWVDQKVDIPLEELAEMIRTSVLYGLERIMEISNEKNDSNI